MLNNVLGVYLDNVGEREFDFPFIALLRAQGFFDIHFTHGQVEFGKDFIAKRLEEELVIQYSFQSKAGNIDQRAWRTDIQGQVLEAVISGISHPNFDREIPHQSVLIITGRLSGNASLGMQDFNITLVNKYQERAVLLWDREILIDMLSSNGLEDFYSITSSGHMSLGDFHILYGKSLRGYISEKEIQDHTRKWLDDSVVPSKRILGAALESEIISQNCRKNGFVYESIHAQLSLIRVLLLELNKSTHDDEILIQEILDRALVNLEQVCIEFTAFIQEEWAKSENNLVKIISGPGKMFTYLVNCARILEISGLTFFLVQSTDAREQIVSFISSFISSEPGCSHIPSDRYAVSIVLPVLALIVSNYGETAVEFLRRSTIWLCDRYEQGDGLADFEATPSEEISRLFGASFDFIVTRKMGESFLATVLLDLAAFAGDKEFYSDVVNDIQATKIFPTYWQIPDSDDMFTIDGRGIISYPSVEYSDNLNNFSDYDFAQHIIHEAKSYQLCDKVSPVTIMTLMPLLRDRYFPTLWNSIVEQILKPPNLSST